MNHKPTTDSSTDTALQAAIDRLLAVDPSPDFVAHVRARVVNTPARDLSWLRLTRQSRSSRFLVGNRNRSLGKVWRRPVVNFHSRTVASVGVIVFILYLAAATVSAQGGAESTPSTGTPLKVEVVLSRFQGEKRPAVSLYVVGACRRAASQRPRAVAHAGAGSREWFRVRNDRL